MDLTRKNERQNIEKFASQFSEQKPNERSGDEAKKAKTTTTTTSAPILRFWFFSIHFSRICFFFVCHSTWYSRYYLLRLCIYSSITTLLWFPPHEPFPVLFNFQQFLGDWRQLEKKNEKKNQRKEVGKKSRLDDYSSKEINILSWCVYWMATASVHEPSV